MKEFKNNNVERFNIVNNIANQFLTKLRIDKTRAIDTYDMAKKIGLNSNNLLNFIDDDALNLDILNNNKTANRDRYIIARAIAKYIILAAVPKADLNNTDVQNVLNDLALSIVIPNKEASSLYRRLKANNISNNIISKKISDLYGVDKAIAESRLYQIIAEENLKYVS